MVYKDINNEVISLCGNSEGKLLVQRQVQDYAFRGREFEDMGFLSFTVETYERRIQDKKNDEIDGEFQYSTTNQDSRYLSGHSKTTSHYRVSRPQNHNVLPNIVGPWLPRRDGEPNSKPYYYASMLSILKPWRELRDLKKEDETWEKEFNGYMNVAGQRERDVIAGCQYYYESKNIVADRDDNDNRRDEADDILNDEEAVIVENDSSIESTLPSVSISFK